MIKRAVYCNKILVRLVQNPIIPSFSYTCLAKRVRNGRDEFVSVCDYDPVSNENLAGPTPRELLLTSLGSCTAMSIKTFCVAAQRKGNCAIGRIQNVLVAVEEVMGKHMHIPVRINVHVDVQVVNKEEGDWCDVVSVVERAVAACPVKCMLSSNNKNFIQSDIKISNYETESV